MPSYRSPHCLTRVMIDGEPELEVAQLQDVMQCICSSLHDVPPRQQVYVGNALLNLAVGRMLREAGRERTATILARLASVVVEHSAPPASHHAIDLTATHS